MAVLRKGAGRLGAVMRDEESVLPLELFFDLVFVLAITQCTALMAHEGTWEGLAKGLLVLGALWWAWSGYAWLTSTVNPEEGVVRLVIFGAMAGVLVTALCVPAAFDDLALTFACAYAVVRLFHIALFAIASADSPDLRRVVVGLGLTTAVCVGILVAASLTDGVAQGALWALALALDYGVHLFGDNSGWTLVPEHFAERFGLIVLIALGESIVAIGVGAANHLTVGIVVAAVLGIALVAAMWWAYFDVVALVAARRLAQEPAGKKQNLMARDSYAYLHFVMVAGIVLVALGLKTTLAHVDEPLHDSTAFALVGGLAAYLTGLSLVRWRNIGAPNRQRLVVAALLLALFPLAAAVDAIATLAIVTAVLCALIAFEATHFAGARDRIRHGDDDMRG